MMVDIRYLDGKLECSIIEVKGNKAFIWYRENGKVGNKKVGYKNVYWGDTDIIAGVRRLWKKRRVSHR